MSESYTIKDIDAFCLYVQEQVDAGTSVADAIQSFRDMQPKIPGEGEGVLVILNYGPKSHAVFGVDTKSVKDELMELNSPGKKDVISFNGKLEFGAGWVITNKTKLKEVLAFFDEHEIQHVEMERDAFVAGEKPKAKKTKAVVKAKSTKKEEEPEEGDLSSMTLPQLKALAKEAELPTTGTKDVLIARIRTNTKTKAKSATAKKTVSKTAKGKSSSAKAKKSEPELVKLVAKKNAQGNHVEEETGLVFIEAPIGTGGRKVKIAVGVQNPESEEPGLASVLPLDEDMVAECEERKWQYLTDDMMGIIEKKDPELHEQLTEMSSKNQDAEEVDEE